MDTLVVQTQYIDEETGTIKKERTRRVPAAFDKEKGYLFWAKKGGCREFFDVPYPKEMSMKERGQMSTLAKHLWSTTNMLGYRGNGGVRAYDEGDIGKIVELKPYQARIFIRKMIRLGLMARVLVTVEGKKYTQFYVNPIYFSTSYRISLNLYLIFKEQLDRVVPDWVKKRYAEEEQKKNEETIRI